MENEVYKARLACSFLLTAQMRNRGDKFDEKTFSEI